MQFTRFPEAGVPRIGAIRVGPLFKTAVDPVPVVVAAEMAVALPARIGALIVVLIVMAGVVVALATVPANPLAVATETVVTVPVGAAPLEAAVMRPLPFTVMLA